MVFAIAAGFLVVGSVIYYARERASRAERELAELRQAVIRILATPNQRSTDWVEQRKSLAQLLGQGNTYSTWSLSLAGMLDEPLLHGGGGDGGTGRLKVTPASLGVTATSTPEFLKALDLGGGDQRTIATHLVNGDIDQARAVLVDNKKGDANRCYILTGGPLQKRLDTAANLRARFPEMTFTAIDPEDEGRLTLRASHGEIRQLLVSSAGAWSHALLLAKGSTDLHLAWLDASNGIASGPGQATSAVHRLQKTDPSDAKGIFEDYLDRPCNADLRKACKEGKCALIFAGASVFALGGKDIAAAGDYFARLTPKEAQAADATKAEFERFVAVEWNHQQTAKGRGTRSAAAAVAGAPAPQEVVVVNPVFVGAIGPRKPDANRI